MSNALLTLDEIEHKKGQLQVQLAIEADERELKRFRYKRPRKDDDEKTKYNRRAVLRSVPDFGIPCASGKRPISPIG